MAVGGKFFNDFSRVHAHVEGVRPIAEGWALGLPIRRTRIWQTPPYGVLVTHPTLSLRWATLGQPLNLGDPRLYQFSVASGIPVPRTAERVIDEAAEKLCGFIATGPTSDHL